MQIEIDFEVFKTLTVRRRDEGHSYNEVLRELLGLDHGQKLGKSPESDTASRSFHSRSLILPNGTQLRATYKGRTYKAAIENGRWLDEAGIEYNSPSAAARAITGNNVNGLRFWAGKRPSDGDWLSLEVMALIG